MGVRQRRPSANEKWHRDTRSCGRIEGMVSSSCGFRFLRGPEKEKASRERGVVLYEKSVLEWEGTCQEESEWHGWGKARQVQKANLWLPASLPSRNSDSVCFDMNIASGMR